MSFCRIPQALFALAVILIIATPACCAPPTTAFSYQGKLTDVSGAPQSGSYPMAFAIFDAPTGGKQIGSTLSLKSVEVSGGLFTVQLDFGPDAFDGTRRWLETIVNEQKLSPRLEIVSVPSAIFAQTASIAQSVPWSGVAGAPSIPTTLPPSGAAGGRLTGTYPNPMLAANAVGTAEIADGAVTSAKLASGALGSYTGNLQNLIGSGSGVSVLGTVVTGTLPLGMVVAGRYAYVTNYSSNAMQVIDVSNPTSPAVVGSVATIGATVGVAVSGTYAYTVSLTGNTLLVIDISNPASPAVVGSVATATGSYAVAVSGRYAYVVCRSANKLQVVDVSNPLSPSVVGSVTTGSYPYNVAVSGRYAYVVNNTANTLQVIDIANPAAPTVVGTKSVAGNPMAVAASGRYACVVGSATGSLQVIDISNPASPSLVGSAVTGNNPASVALAGRYACVTNAGSNMLQIFDLSNPASPASVAQVSTGSNPCSVSVSGRYAYVTNSSANTMQVIDITGIETTAMNAHSLEAGALQVRGSAAVANQLSVGGGLNVGASGLFSDGDVATSGQVKASGFRLGSSATVGQVLTTDANGVGTWQNASLALPFSSTISSSSNALSITNTSGPVAYLVGSTTAGSYALSAINTGASGGAGYFAITNASSTAPAVTGFSQANGPGGCFVNISPGASVPAVQANVSGTGPALQGNGTYAGEFNGRVYVSGKLGVGTSSPEESVSVVGSLKVDQTDKNDGTFNTAAIRFGAGLTGEGIASKRTTGGNWAGLDFYTGSANRLTITNGGNVGIGFTSTSYKLDVNGTVRCTALTQTSDARLKTNIRPIANALESTLRLRGVTFDWNRDSFSDKSFPEGRQIGVIAQEVEKVLPELVSKDGQGYESVAYDKLVPVLIEAIKAQQAKIDSQQKQIDDLTKLVKEALAHRPRD